MPALYLLYESASGYALLEAHGLDAIGGSTPAVQESVTDLDRFGKVSFFFSRRGFDVERERERAKRCRRRRRRSSTYAQCRFHSANAAPLALDGHHDGSSSSSRKDEENL